MDLDIDTDVFHFQCKSTTAEHEILVDGKVQANIKPNIVLLLCKWRTSAEESL